MHDKNYRVLANIKLDYIIQTKKTNVIVYVIKKKVIEFVIELLR